MTQPVALHAQVPPTLRAQVRLLLVPLLCILCTLAAAVLTMYPVSRATTVSGQAPSLMVASALQPQPAPEPWLEPEPEPYRNPDPDHNPSRYPDPDPSRYPNPDPSRHPNPDPSRHPNPEPGRHPNPEPSQVASALAMSIDYSLFLLSRFAEEVHAGHGAARSVEIMLATSGHTVAVSGGTLVLCFLGMLLMPVHTIQTMGLAAAVTVVYAAPRVEAGVTLLLPQPRSPALLG